MTKTQTICDMCERIKGETNHWFFIWFDPLGFHIYNKGDLVPERAPKDLCSEQCLMRALSQWIESKNQVSEPDLGKLGINPFIDIR